jgi:hypothetical protein
MYFHFIRECLGLLKQNINRLLYKQKNLFLTVLEAGRSRLEHCGFGIW